MSSRFAKTLLIATIILLIVAFCAFDLHHFLTREYLKDRQQAFADVYIANRLLTIAIFLFSTWWSPSSHYLARRS